MDEDKTRGLRFEEGLNALEQIVARLEAGDLPLEEALRVFEEGVGLVRVLNQKLTAAEHRIEVLSRAEDGSVRVQGTDEEKR